MPVSVTMPRLGESVTEGTVTRWLKQEGDRVEVDEPLLEVSTDKVDTEIPSPGRRACSPASWSARTRRSRSAPSSRSSPATARTPVRLQRPARPQPPLSDARRPRRRRSRPPPRPGPAPAASPRPRRRQHRPPAGRGRAGAPASGTAVTMPALGESVTEGTVTRWLKQVGDTVEVDEPLLEVSTDKVDTEIPSPVAGVLLEIKVAEDETVPVGADLAVIGAAGGARPPRSDAGPRTRRPRPRRRPRRPAAASPRPPHRRPPRRRRPHRHPPRPRRRRPPARRLGRRPTGGDARRLRDPAGPQARRRARRRPGDADRHRRRRPDPQAGRARRGGPGDRRQGRRHAAAAPAQPRAAAGAGGRARCAAGPRRCPGCAPSSPSGWSSRCRSSAQLTTVVEVDVTRIAKLRDQAKADFQARHGVKLSFLPFFALATVEALRQHPIVNASIDVEAGTVTYHDAEHLGIAVDTERGLVVPVIRDAGDLNLAGLAKRIADLAERTRTNKISPDELSGGTFTLTNTGSRGALFDTPIINQPQVGILGTGAVVTRAVVVDDPDLGEIIAPRSMVYLALSYDHRLVDGADAARFLTTIKERLEAGDFESDLGL